MTDERTAGGADTAAGVRPALRGLTWDHPRGYAVPEELQRRDAAPGGAPPGGVALRWDRQPLEGFESHPIIELAHGYDVLVVDHPGLGDALAAGALTPLPELFSAEELAGWRATSVGASFDSYTYEGGQWALPLDAAAQVCVVRPDLLDAPPATWADVREIARRLPYALCLGGPHALMMLMSLCVAAGAPPGGPGAFLAAGPAERALELMTELYDRADRDLSLGNPIAVMDAMAAGAPVAFSPLIYGYVTYNAPGAGRWPLRATDAPADPATGRRGSVLGGTGLAVSAFAADRAAAAAHLRRLLGPEVQAGLAPRLGGQPGARYAWTAADVNEAWRGFYAETLATVETAWVRPRHRGWIGFQERASALVREGVVRRRPAATVVRELNDLYRRPPTGGG